MLLPKYMIPERMGKEIANVYTFRAGEDVLGKAEIDCNFSGCKIWHTKRITAANLRTTVLPVTDAE